MECWIFLVGTWAVGAGACVAQSTSAVAKPDDGVAQQVLRDYLAAPDDSYAWKQIRSGNLGGTKYVELILTSQRWRDAPWQHRLFILLPEKMRSTKQALLVIAGGRWQEKFADPDYQDPPFKEAVLFSTVAQQTGTPIAILLQVPQQPLFDGMVEDEIISYTFDQFLESDDNTWPLLLPMVKSAVKAMDAVQEYCHEELKLDIEYFTVTGASKRGWTTWLTGASDPRVNAIAPMVIDMLNMPAQLQHQQEVYGGFSEEIHDYTDRKIPERMDSSRGAELRDIVDPLAYRDSLLLPKLIILGTNDPYWTLDSLNLYWSQLLGPKYILYVPNNGHGLKDYSRILGAVYALQEHAREESQLPELSWEFDEQNSQVTLKIESNETPTACRIWQASSPTQDFRQAKWTATETSIDQAQACPRSPKDYRAYIGELVFARKSLPLHLSTNVKILEPSGLQP